MASKRLSRTYLEGGQPWEQEIPKALQASDFILIFFSQNSIRKIGYVQNEFKLALESWRLIPEGMIHTIPVRLDNCEVPREFRRFQWVDIFNERGFERIIRAIRFGLAQRQYVKPEAALGSSVDAVATLELYDNTEKIIARYSLTSTLLTIGRIDSDITLPSPLVSRDHALVTIHTDYIVVEDKRSENGTWVEGRRIRKPTIARFNQDITIGDFSLRFLHIEDGTSAAISTVPNPKGH